jgi:hypothetical protein
VTAARDAVENGKEYDELLDTIINQAEAIKSGRHTAPRSAVVALLRHNVDTLAAWTPEETKTR